jgi:hypothetical protein
LDRHEYVLCRLLGSPPKGTGSQMHGNTQIWFTATSFNQHVIV